MQSNNRLDFSIQMVAYADKIWNLIQTDKAKRERKIWLQQLWPVRERQFKSIIANVRSVVRQIADNKL